MSWGNVKMVDWSEVTSTPAANFMGEYDPANDYDYGDICLRDNEIWINNGVRDWTFITEVDQSNYITNYVTNCPNCGAPMTNHKCAYCGTEDYGRR